MKNSVRLLIVSFLFISCQQKIKTEDIAKINGYWEIEKVVFDEGKDKNYTINESYDFFEIGKNNNGFRKKVMPQLDGTFIVNDTQESLKVRFEKDKVYLDYVTSYAKWSEELIEITDDKMVLENTEKKQYHYKKATPINILGDGKKTK
jgi:Lipocalin-like domain